MSPMTPYASWTLAMPCYSPRSPLYSLEPIGIGTPLVESLTGYVMRLADAHAVSVADLIHYELGPRHRATSSGSSNEGSRLKGEEGR